MKTIIKKDGKEVLVFRDFKTLKIGEQVKCFGIDCVVVSIENRKMNWKDNEVVVVTIMDKTEYQGIKVDEEDLKKYTIAIPSESVTLKCKTPFECDRNPFRF